MPRISKSYVLSAAADGSMDYKNIIDLSAELSALYGRLIRQSHVFKVKKVDIRLFNPDTSVQDNAMSASGKLVFYSPTKYRKQAWKNGFNAVQRLRKQVGLKEAGYDFRVGLHTEYPNIPQQAFVRNENELLVLGGLGQNSCFDVHNEMINQTTMPDDPDINGFGTPWSHAEDDLDFKENDDGFFMKYIANNNADSIPWMVGFAGAAHNLTMDDYAGITNAEHIEGPFNVMCGLIGVQVDTTIPDDSDVPTPQIEDFGLEIVVEVESWSKMLPKRSKKYKRAGRSKKFWRNKK